MTLDEIERRMALRSTRRRRAAAVARLPAIDRERFAKRQREAKRQPGGGSRRRGTVPPIASRRVLCAAARSMRGIERMSPCV